MKAKKGSNYALLKKGWSPPSQLEHSTDPNKGE